MSKNIIEERCECGAYMSTTDYKRIKKWRKNHKSYHPTPEPEKEGSVASTERAGYQIYELETETPVIYAKAGFTKE